jgi:curli biogenesis system outer membrane secretion channel CsgG
MKRILLFLSFATFFHILGTGCAVKEKSPPTPIPSLALKKKAISIRPSGPILRRKVGIGRFSNETNYGRGFLTDSEGDPLGKQAADILGGHLVNSGKFIVVERPDIKKIKTEINEFSKGKDDTLLGIDTMILGSITEFGRETVGKTGFLSKTKKQVARCKVTIRLVDIATGYAFFSETGAGEATIETGTILGMGSKASYDATLNDKAINSAITDLIDAIIKNLEERPWKSDILSVEGNTVFISGGERQGLKKEQVLGIYKPGKRIKSQQSGAYINLPPTLLGKIKINSFFGNNEIDEGSVCLLVDGGTGILSNYKELFIANLETK